TITLPRMVGYAGNAKLQQQGASISQVGFWAKGGILMVNPDMEILVVDDASAMRRIVRGLLKELGFKHIREAENGQVALQELKKKKADFVVSDWNMPVMTGIDLLRAIRADESLKSIPVLMVTAE